MCLSVCLSACLSVWGGGGGTGRSRDIGRLLNILKQKKRTHKREMAQVKKFDSLIQATISVKISNLHICFCSFYFSTPILEKDNFL